MSRRGCARGLLALALGPVACEPAASDDSRCPAWTEAEDGRCVLRSWSLAVDPLGDPGAGDVQVALGPGDQALLAWTHATSTQGWVVLAEPTATGWSTTEVTHLPGVALEPAIALGPEGRASLAWKQQADEGAVFLATRDDRATWAWPDARLSWPGNAYEPRVAIGSDGEALMVWNQWIDQTFGVAIATRSADDPDGPVVGPRDRGDLLSPPVNFSNAPRLAVGEDGEALIAWYQAPVDDLMVYVSERRRGSATFDHPAADAFISPRGGPVDSHPEANPQPALHSSGAAAVVWTQRVAEGVFPVFLATRAPEGAWRRPTSIADSLSRADAFARCPLAAFGPDGALVVTWYQTRGPETQVLVWRDATPDLDGTEADETIEPQRLSTLGVEAVHPALAIAPDGGVVVVWAELDAARWRVLARRYQPGSDRWLPAEVLSEPEPGQAPEPRIALADDGRVLVAWAQGLVGEGRVYTAWLR